MIVVTKHIALSHQCIRIVQVVLHLRRIGCIGTNGISVNVVIGVSTQQIVHSLIVTGIVSATDKT